MVNYPTFAPNLIHQPHPLIVSSSDNESDLLEAFGQAPQYRPVGVKSHKPTNDTQNILDDQSGPVCAAERYPVLDGDNWMPKDILDLVSKIVSDILGC